MVHTFFRRRPFWCERRTPLRNDRGVALLAVVVVLSTLLVVGVLFAYTVDLDLKASKYYRDAGLAEQVALEGLHRAIAEIQYDMWGVNEKRAFLLADSSKRLSDAAYHRLTGSGSRPIVSALAKWRQSVEKIGPHGVLTDYRWLTDFDQNTRQGLHAGAVYHDEFLPEGTDNSDVWQLGLHVNRGDIYFEGTPPRSYRSDENLAGGLSGSFWPGLRTRPWDREWDYIDTRIAGDSFYKIFRFELIDPLARLSTYAGVATSGLPLPRRDWLQMKTHLGDASFAGQYGTDSRGGAVNINQVNNDYMFESYYAQITPNPNDTYVPFHYKDSKWIEVYDGASRLKWGRYALLVWGDCGTPNANYQYDAEEQQSSGSRLVNTGDYFRILDSGFSPRGGPIKNDINAGADILKTNNAAGWHKILGTAIGSHVRTNGPFTSRAELNLFLRKSPGAGAALNQSEPRIDEDAEIICSLVSVHAYENLMGPHWERDRLVIDVLGFGYGADKSWVKIPGQALAHAGSMMNAGPRGNDTRRQFMNALEDLKFYWGPDGVREGEYTPYNVQGASPSFAAAYPDAEAFHSRGRFMSWIAQGPFEPSAIRVKEATTSRIGWAFNADPANTLGAPTFWGSGSGGPTRDARVGDLTATIVHSLLHAPRINEVGLIDVGAAGAAGSLKGDYAAESAVGVRGWEALDDNRTYAFVELVHPPWSLAWHPISFSFRGNGTDGDLDARGYRWWSGARNEKTTFTLRVDGSTDIFADPTTRIICLDADLDDRGGPDGFHQDELDTGHVFARRSNKTHHQNQDKRRGKNSSGFAGQMPSDPPMVVPTLEEITQKSMTVRRRLDGEYIDANGTYGADSRAGPILTIAHNKFRYNNAGSGFWSGPNLKQGWGRFLPSNFLLVLFDKVKFPGSKITFAVKVPSGPERIVNYVELPGPISATTTTKSWSCVDFFSNQHPAMWQLVEATPAWRKRTSLRDRWDLRAWANGLNTNAVTTYLPGGESWPNGSYKVMDRDGSSKGGLNGARDQDASWVAACYQELAMVIDSRSRPLTGWDRLMTCPLGFFPRPAATWETGLLRGADPKPSMFMRTLRDLMRVAPVDQFFTMGYMGQYNAQISKHAQYAIYDSFDNNLNGHTDDVATTPRFPRAVAYTRAGRNGNGYYVGDRAVVGRININEMSHPAPIWYTSIARGAYSHQNAIVGRKPFKGYTSWIDIITRSSIRSQGLNTPYHANVWYENLFGDASSDHSARSDGMEGVYKDVLDTSRILFAGNSPVYTVYVTAQSLNEWEKALAEVKIRCTLERTWDGKTNLLDFKWIPSDVRPQ